jgi:hypothetical protein
LQGDSAEKTWGTAEPVLKDPQSIYK